VLARRASGWLAMMGQLRTGVMVDQAQAEMAGLKAPVARAAGPPN
jgi:hypothetical protein